MLKYRFSIFFDNLAERIPFVIFVHIRITTKPKLFSIMKRCVVYVLLLNDEKECFERCQNLKKYSLEVDDDNEIIITNVYMTLYWK